MKYLKLDARHPECHGLARALAGSRTKENGMFVAFVPHQQFYDWFSFYVIDRIMDGEYWAVSAEMKHECGWGEAAAYSEILLPIATLKLCPYVAMREGVSLNPCGSPLVHISLGFDDVWRAFFKDSVSEYPLHEITLDLDNLPKGAEVVE